MATQPLSDDVLNDASGFPDSPAPDAADAADDTLELTEDQALDDSLADPGPDEGADEGDEGKSAKEENPVEKRIKGALRARDEARERLANAEAERQALAKRLEALEANLASADEPDAQPDEDAPDPTQYEYGALDPKYINDVVEYRTKTGIKAALGELETTFQEQQEQKAQQQAAQEMIDRAKEVVAKGVALYDDYEEVVWERGMRQEYPLTETTFSAICEADNSAQIAYALASDPAEAARVAALSPIQQVKYVIEKDQELSGKPARVTKAPPPPGQQTRGASGKFTVAGDTDDLNAFEKEFFKKN